MGSLLAGYKKEKLSITSQDHPCDHRHHNFFHPERDQEFNQIIAT